jgi:shikimate kinase
VRHGAKQLDTVVEVMTLTHSLQQHSQRPVTANDKMRLSKLLANRRYDLSEQINALARHEAAEEHDVHSASGVAL